MAGKINVRISNQLWRVGVPIGGTTGQFLQKNSSTDYDLVWVSGVTAAPHTIASHSDTSGTGPELDSLTDGSNVDSLHIHSIADTHIAAANPHSASASSGVNTDITSITGVIVDDYKETLEAATTSANVTIDLADGTVQRWILDASRQFTMPADPGAFGKSFVLILEPATYVVSWNSSPTIEWLTSDGAPPTLVTAANLVNVVTFIWDDIDSRWLGFLGGSETA